ncbi:MAG: hypothetical protein AAFQ13_06775 [Pseudomonadota bacterium]
MSTERGPRPWPIHAFAAIFLATGLLGLILGLNDLELAQSRFAELRPDWSWDRDRTIIAPSARATIFLIPILLVWVRGRSPARWVIGFFTGLGLINALWALTKAGMAGELLAYLATHTQALATSIALAGAAALLFTVSAKRWLLHGKEDHGDARTHA